MQNKKYLDDLINLLLETKDKSLLHDFLIGILTPVELEEIPIRLQIVKKLKAGISQRAISEDLKVGIGTITRGSTEIKKGRFKCVK